MSSTDLIPVNVTDSDSDSGPSSSTTVMILVWRGTNKLDIEAARYVGLLLLKDNDQCGGLIRPINPENFFELDTEWNYNPVSCGTLTGSAYVGKIPRHIDVVMAVLQQVPVVNDGSEWNCHHWVGSALRCLVNFKWISDEQRDSSLTIMAEHIVEAAIDEQAVGTF